MDPTGADYWSYENLTEPQRNLAAALKPQWEPLRTIIQQTKSDTNSTNPGARTKWEKLFVLGILLVDNSRSDNIYVRRGEKWSDWWGKEGNLIHGLQMIANGTPIDEFI